MATQTSNTTGLKPKTINKLQKVLEYIKEEPKRLDMGVWGLRLNPSDKFLKLKLTQDSPATAMSSVSELPPCGTAACLAGTVVLLFAPKRQLKGLLNEETETEFVLDKKGAKKTVDHTYCTFGDDTSDVAEVLLEITHAQAQALFYPGNWPQAAKGEYAAAAELTTPKARANGRYKATRNYVNQFITVDGNMTKLYAAYDEEVDCTVALAMEEE